MLKRYLAEFCLNTHFSYEWLRLPLGDCHNLFCVQRIQTRCISKQVKVNMVTLANKGFFSGHLVTEGCSSILLNCFINPCSKIYHTTVHSWEVRLKENHDLKALKKRIYQGASSAEAHHTNKEVFSFVLVFNSERTSTVPRARVLVFFLGTDLLI